MKFSSLIKFIGIGLILGYLLNNTTPIQAKDHRVKVNESVTEPVTIQVLPRLPKDNIGGQQLGYFNLPMVGHTSRLEKLSLYNPTNQAITVKLKAVDATTNDQGQVDYINRQKASSQLLKQPGSQMMTFDKKVIIAPQTTQNITVRIKNLKAGFTGQKAVALNLSASGINQPHNSIQNQYVYVIGMILQGRPLTNAHLKKLQLTAIRLTQRKVFRIHLANPDATYLKKTQIKFRLVSQWTSFFNYQLTKTNLKIAPSSAFDLQVPLAGKRVVPGIYRLTMAVKTDQYQQTVNRYVAITKTHARLITNHQYRLLKRRQDLIKGALILVVAGLVIGGFYHYYRRRKRDLNE